MTREIKPADFHSHLRLIPDFDLELYLLEKGLKKVIKKECIRIGDCGEVIDKYEKLGLTVIRDPDDYCLDTFGNYLPVENGCDMYSSIIVSRKKPDAERAFR